MMIMASGGARNRSGPPPQEGSGRSDARGFKLTALPAGGYTGPIPPWPLPPHATGDPDQTEWMRNLCETLDERELELWEWAWRTPQACAWSLASERWRAQIVARWVRQAALCERPSAKAADHGQLHRYADQIGLTTAGLREMGWKVAVDELAQKRADEQGATQPARRQSSRDRMKVVGGSGR